jgi:GTP-binding protein LepA
LEIIKERLLREFGFAPAITTPGVVYEIAKTDGTVRKIYSASEMPEANFIKEIREPFVKLDIVTPAKFLGSVMELVNGTTRALYRSTEYIDNERVILSFEAPLAEVIVNLHDGIKSATSGFASFSYELTNYVPGDLVRMDIYVAEEKVEALSQIVPRISLIREGNRVVKKLKEVIPRQNFLVKIQASVGAKFIARENIAPFRKDVTGHLYGGDVTRKRKLLEKQKRGKKRMRGSGKVEIPQEAFLNVLKR